MDFDECYRLATEHSNEGVIIVSGDKRLFINQRCLELAGYHTAQELDKKPFLSTVHPDDREKVRKIISKRQSGKPAPSLYEFRFLRPDGSIIYVEISSCSITYMGQPASLRYLRDISNHKQIEEKLRQSEERYRNILESIQEGYFELDLGGNYTFANEANCKFLGYTKEELIGMNYRRHTDEETAKKLYKPYLELYRTGKPIKMRELESIRKDGTKAIYETSVSLIRNSKGNPVGFRGVSRDVTARKKMEEALHQSAEKYRTILEDIDECYFELDLAGNFTSVNNAGCMILGYSEKELIGMNNRDYTDKETAKKMFYAFNNLYRTGENVKELDYRIIKKNGTTVFTEFSASLIKDSEGKPLGFRGITRDVTRRKQMEEALRQSVEKYRTILENMQEGYFEIDLTGAFTFVNDAECRNIGYSRQELIGMNYRRFQDEKTVKNIRKIFTDLYKIGQPLRLLDVEIIKKDGTKAFNETSVSLIRNAEGKPIGFRGISRDVTERRQMEETIRQSEEKYRTIIDEMDEWYFEIDLAGNIVFINDAVARSVGYSLKELIGINFRSFIKKDQVGEIYKIFLQVYETGEPTKSFSYEFIRPDGSITLFELSIFPKLDGEGKVFGFRGVGHDITERKRTEQQLNSMIR